MSEVLRAHLTKFINISDAEFDEILTHFQFQTFNKKENLLVAGQRCQFQYFVIKGCLRKFFINEKGTEQTTEFAIENWWMTDYMAFDSGKVSEFYIQAIENTEVVTIDFLEKDKLFIACPKMERYFRCIYQRAYAASQMRIKYLFDFSKEEFYHHLNKNHPEFVQRIPQYLIASFLGFTPEYLSEIRGKIRS